jgi:hypothetical protein
MSLLVPQPACSHPIDRLRVDMHSPAGDLRPENVRALIQCLACMGYWTPDAAPIHVIDACLELIARGSYAQMPRQL